MKEVVIVLFSGGMGTLCRWGTSKIVKSYLSNPFPFATLAVNVLGCLMFGLVMEMDILPKTVKLACTVGFLGAFTTFSTFGFESLELIKQGNWSMAALNAMANCLFGLGAVWLGSTAGKVVFQ